MGQMLIGYYQWPTVSSKIGFRYRAGLRGDEPADDEEAMNQKRLSDLKMIPKHDLPNDITLDRIARSEERRVGKECRL